jgi:Holliday junction resolvase
MSGAKHRRKGDRAEREVVALCRAHGLDAERVPLSGAAGGSFADDVIVRLSGRTLKIEVKARASGDGFATLARWLHGSSMLVLKQNNRPPLAVIELPLLVEMLAAVEARKRGAA